MVGLLRRRRRVAEAETPVGRQEPQIVEAVDLADNDPALAVFASAAGPVELDALDLDSPAVEAMRAQGVRVVVPLVAQGELIGVLNLGPRLSDQPYSSDDRRLLASLAAQAAPALRVAQLVREQEQEARHRERREAEMRVAQLIQQNFLPKDLQAPSGWEVDAFYRPAREVGGDFYDVIDLPDGRLGVVVGDVTDKGVPAALVMASSRSVLRAAASRVGDPAKVLERVNDQLVPDIPEAMFVTALYGVLDPADGTFRFANAGHNLPCILIDGEVSEPRATGMPLGLLPGSVYDENEIVIPPGGSLLLYSDALPEAHSPTGEMFGFPGVRRTVASGGDRRLVDHLLTELEQFTGPDWEQEDDITFLVLKRAAGRSHATPRPPAALVDVEVASRPDGEREIAQQVSAAAAEHGIGPERLRSLETAVAEAVMNAMEHGNQYQDDLTVRVRLTQTDDQLLVTIQDAGLSGPFPTAVDAPDLEAKLRGEENPRGWGLFLISQMVDDLRTRRTADGNVTELVMNLEAPNE